MEIHTLDLNYQNRSRTIASYLVVGPNGPVLVETGPQSTSTTLIDQLSEHGYQVNDIRHVLVTHIHLDHAGAAGWFAQQGAQVYVHHVGAPHLVDPSKLLASAGRIYGDEMDSLWGETVPAPADRITPVNDNDVIEVAGLEFMAIDTPGHAYHHHAYQLADIVFTGDAAGIQIPGTYFVDLPAPPPEFNLGLWQQSIERLLSFQFSAIYPTHFGRLDDWQQQLEDLAALMESAAEFVFTRMQSGLERDQILAQYLEWHRFRAEAAGLTGHMFEQYEAANPHHMSVDGLMRYWRKKMPTP